MKPTSLMIKDGREMIISAINNTNLPACIVKLILQDINLQVDKLCAEEEQRDIQKYQKELSNVEKEAQDENN